ncbi:MAG TPA: radical SAM family heme chaperone HemW [Candidatus Limnocylindria bacterium]|nr:radical SAM family heme chaperone HemW [Candidatus Limnocylindria bacterium]
MTSLYVHIPFCASRCPYCDFATAPATSPLRARYLAALRVEIAREGAALGRPSIDTAFFGGGTPSLLEPDEIRSLGDAIRASFDFRPEEVTFEANPATLDRARLDAWRALGATRISLGAQSFSARALASLGRTHTAADIAPAVRAARSVGLDVSLDLIFGRPGEPDGEWQADLEAALALGPDHLSAYPLELAREPDEGGANWGGGGWPIVARWREAAAAAQPDDDGQADRYELAAALLRGAGYRHYEIANWARPGTECRHNLVYWRNGEWLGVGAGAHSHLAGLRSRQPGGLLAYVARIERGAGRIAEGGADTAVDTAILALRLDEGLDLAAYGARFGAPARARVDAALRGLDAAGVLERSGDRVALTDRGRFVANEVFVRLVPA